jgi:hypothetical protein
MTKYAGAEWLQNQIDCRRNPFQLSDFAKEVADIMGQVEVGLYHWENVVSNKGWKGDNRIDLNYPCNLRTGFFGSSLTLLVLLCHAKKIQLTIAPCSPSAVRLSFVRASEQATMDKAISHLKDTVEAIAAFQI